MVRCLVEQGADKGKADIDGLTPLWAAAWQGHLAVVRYLVEHGADFDVANRIGTSPLIVAEAGGHVEVAAYLRAAGAGARSQQLAVAGAGVGARWCWIS